MYRDESKIKIITLLKEEENPEFLITKYSDSFDLINASAYLNKKYIAGCSWDESFYKRAGVSFEHSWKSFYIERDIDAEEKIYKKLNPNNQDYIIIHSTGSDGVNRIDYSKISKDLLKIEIDKQIDFFNYMLLIENAKEVHCVNSSFIHLVDRIHTKGNLFYHKNYKKRGNDIFIQRKKWNIIEDPNYLNNKYKMRGNHNFHHQNINSKNVRFFKVKK